MQNSQLQLRHELKYYIRYYDYEVLRRRLQAITQRDIHSVNDEGYHIRSLYFDDLHDSALFEKNYGIYKRKKYRIRIYNKSDSVIKLERKNKIHEYVAKESAPLTRHEYEELMDGRIDFLREKDHYLIQEFYRVLQDQMYRPRVVTDYIREAYTLATGNVRITFDKQLMTTVNSLDIFDPDLVTAHTIHEPKMIMEVKFDEFLPEHVRRVLQLPAHQRSAISKYVICREESQKFYNL